MGRLLRSTLFALVAANHPNWKVKVLTCPLELLAFPNRKAFRPAHDDAEVLFQQHRILTTIRS